MLAGCLIGLGAGTPRGAAARARLGEQANAPHGECRHGDRLGGGNSKPTGCEQSRVFLRPPRGGSPRADPAPRNAVDVDRHPPNDGCPEARPRGDRAGCFRGGVPWYCRASASTSRSCDAGHAVRVDPTSASANGRRGSIFEVHRARARDRNVRPRRGRRREGFCDRDRRPRGSLVAASRVVRTGALRRSHDRAAFA